MDEFEDLSIDAKTVQEYLNDVVYSDDPDYVPTDFALHFINFIKLVNDGNEENLTPVIHYKMLDNIVDTEEDDRDTINMCHRGVAKSTLLGEYLFLYLAVFGIIPGFGMVDLAIYVSDSIENGVKNMRKNLEYRWHNSDFLQKAIPHTRFTDIRWEFRSIDGRVFVVKGYGAKTGVRGARELSIRPVLAVLDDLISDEDARSKTVIQSVEDTVYKAIDYALHPTTRKIIWSGTPFNAKDPLYKAVESGAWRVNVYPVCERFPCSEEEFKGSWPDRFTYDYVTKQYKKAVRAGKTDSFYQELMLQIMSDEDRLIMDGHIRWYDKETFLKQKGMYNYYITTDLATSEKDSADYSVISVWAYNSNQEWFWVDGICKKQTLDLSLDDLFRLAQQWKPLGVGIEVTGQQQGFIPLIKRDMVTRKCFFTLTSDKASGEEGIRPTTNKFDRFMIMVPQIRAGRIYFPKDDRHTAPMLEMWDELTLLAQDGFKSKHDDFADTISMLQFMNPFAPSSESSLTNVHDVYYTEDIDDFDDELPTDTYIV